MFNNYFSNHYKTDALRQNVSSYSEVFNENLFCLEKIMKIYRIKDSNLLFSASIFGKAKTRF